MTPCGACGAFPQGTTLALGETPSAAFPHGLLRGLLTDEKKPAIRGLFLCCASGRRERIT